MFIMLNVYIWCICLRKDYIFIKYFYLNFIIVCCLKYCVFFFWYSFKDIYLIMGVVVDFKIVFRIFMGRDFILELFLVKFDNRKVIVIEEW